MGSTGEAYEVRYERAALDGLAALDKGDANRVFKKVNALEHSPDQQGVPLGNKANIDLTGYRKLVLLDRRVRAIYRVEGSSLVRVIVIGKREDMEVYRLALAEIDRLGLA